MSDHERYGWQFLGLSDGEFDDLTRVYQISSSKIGDDMLLESRLAIGFIF